MSGGATGSVAWKLERVRAMSPAEIAWRAGRAARGALERARLAPLAPARVPRAAIRPDVGVLFPRCADDERALVAAEYPDAWRRTLVADAERILRGEVPFFGRWRATGWPPEWRRDPMSGRDAGLVFYTALLHPSEERVGDYRAVWEVNRHASLVALARAAYVTGEARYAVACIAGLRSFLEQNPTGRGINWTSSLELALRAIAWMGAWCFLEAGGFADDETRRVWTKAIARCVGYVRAHMSAYSSANNHLMGEAAALVIAGSVLPDLPDARRWRRRGADIVARETLRQIHPDGVGAEQSVHYLTFTAELAAVASLCAARAGEPLPAAVNERLGRAAEFLHAIADTRGNRPVLGDSDDAVALPLGSSPHAMPGALIDLVRGIASGGAARVAHEPAYWLLSAAHTGGGAAAPRAPVRVFAEGGVSIVRSRETLAVLDTGPLGYLSLAAHGHADPLSLWVSIAGDPVIIDPGTGSYAPARRAERDYFRRARAHATILVDDREPAEIRGAFLWGRRYRSWSRFASGDAEWSVTEGEHDGYRGARCSVRRRVHADAAGYVLVVDVLESTRAHDVTVSWPCATAFAEAEMDQGAHVLRAQDGRAIAIASRAVCRDSAGAEQPFPLTFTHERGRRDPIDGWASLDYDDVRPCTVVRAHARTTPGTFVLVTVISAGSGHARLRAVRAAGTRSVAAVVECASAGHEWIALLGGSPAEVSAEGGPLDFAGEHASVRVERNAEGVAVSARGSGEFRVRDRVVRNDREWTWRWASAAVREGARARRRAEAHPA